MDKAPVVIEKYQQAVAAMGQYMQQNGLVCEPQAVYNLKGDAARVQFINRFKEVQRLKTQLDQYTDLDAAQKQKINAILPEDELRSLRCSYLETAQRLKDQQGKTGNESSNAQDAIEELDFEFVLFASAVIDYDYIMALITRYSQQTPGKQKMSREELIGLIQADAKFMDARDDIADYIDTLQVGKGLDEKQIRTGFERFKAEKHARIIAAIADKHGLESADLQAFVDHILRRMIFDGELLNDLLAPLELGWKARIQKELALMEELIPLLNKLAQGREISGLGVYE